MRINRPNMKMPLPQVDSLHNAFLNAENNLTLTPSGNGRYDMHPTSLAPKVRSPVRSPGQVMAQKKMSMASGIKRRTGFGLLK